MEWFVSRFNQLAFDALNEYNLETVYPITLIYGPCGVGKTELLRMVYHQNKSPQVLLMDAQIFSQRYVLAAQNHCLSEFRTRIRNHKLLILDQLERLEGKKNSLEELLHTLDSLTNNGAKIIASFQGEPQRAAFLTKRLYSRLFGGLTLPVLTPTTLELVEYARLYARSRSLIIQKDILSKLAAQAENLTDVQKLLNEFVKFTENDLKASSYECWEEYLMLYREKNSLKLIPDNVIQKISEMTGILAEEIKGSSRVPSTAAARKFAVYAIRKLCALSYPQLGVYFQRAHSVMMKSYQQFEDTQKENPEWRQKFEILKAYFDKGEG
ncbi:DnaA ATPase domain-containing protein [Desulfitobacterium sp. AusDCA]|uniref:DnaA ATPase domain-containing protein n=1 Tax=Desulfitobacterium sp. AusDCA TaxID=3240383 RepID=UPI003DA723F2